MIPVQVQRLVLVTILVVAAFFMVRSQWVPPSFGARGHYRADSVAEIAALPIEYGGEEACTTCHAGVDEIRVTSRHAGVRCESCHGPAKQHSLDPVANPKPHPERALEIMMTPHLSSAMAVFGFVYAWYLMAVLLVELWLDYRHDMVLSALHGRGPKRWIHAVLTLGVFDISEKALDFDDRFGRAVTIIGIPSAFLLHGYVGFIFGSIKANPWWSTVLMPIVFLFSAIVSGIAMIQVLYLLLRRSQALTSCLDTLAKYLFYALLLDFALEGLEIIHRMYVMEESFEIISLLVSGRLFLTMVLFQFGLGTIVPLLALGAIQLFPIAEAWRRRIYPVAGLLILFGVFFMRWNVVVGGQLFSKSLRGFTTYKIEIIGQDGLLVVLAIAALPFFILAGLLWIFDPWKPSPHSGPNV